MRRRVDGLQAGHELCNGIRTGQVGLGDHNLVRDRHLFQGLRVTVEVELRDAWVWDMYRPARFVTSVKVLTFRDVNVEELATKDL